MSEIENFADWECISSEINSSLLRSSKTISQRILKQNQRIAR